MSPRNAPGNARRAPRGGEPRRRRKPAGSGGELGAGPSTANPPFEPPDWPAAKVELRPLSWLRESDSNPRTHPPSQIELLARSMKEDGVTMPILADERGEIIAGAGRRRAALAAGFEEYPVVIARGWSEEKKRAARIKDNAYGLLSGWDRELIRRELGMLKAAGFDMPLLGFGDGELVSFMTSPGPPSEFPEYGEGIAIDHKCPKCGYRWSGKAGR